MTRPEHPPGGMGSGPRQVADPAGSRPRTSPQPKRKASPVRLPAGAASGPDAAALIALSAERDTWTGRLLAAERAAYLLGYDDGFRDGVERLWARCRALPPVEVSGPALAELERRRWGPGGRERFGDPRPGDHRGGLAGGGRP